MAVKIDPRLGKTLYALLFNGVLPLLLWAWARGTSHVVHLAVPGPTWLGWVLVSSGALLMAWATWALRVWGGGVPMNPYPPPRLVSRGPYAWLTHPIYVGAVMVCGGLSVAFQSASALWLVTPSLALGSAALVLGHEGRGLDERFGATRPRAFFSLLVPGDAPVTAAERLSLWFTVLLPWTFLYEAVVWLGPAVDAVDTTLSVEKMLPVWPEAELFYLSAYVLAAVTPWWARDRTVLRAWQLRGWASMALVVPLHVALPLVATPRPFTPDGWLGALLVLERAWDSPAAAFPSYHVVWALLCAGALAPRLGAWAWLWAAAITVASWMTGMHSVLDVLAGLLVGALLLHGERAWESLRHAAELTCNSWREWRLGPLRVINHGAYAGVGTAISVVMVQALLGSRHVEAVGLVALGGLVGAGLWAQVIEGSSGLMRPYGFYGGVLGIMVACVALQWLHGTGWVVLAAYAVSAPVVQSWGRLRCLVQGCCHGSPCAPWLGISYRHPRSRVLVLSSLGSQPLHPTQLYSILWNAWVLLCTARLWTLQVPPPMVCGVYLLLTGVGRFVEESHRGEPQTPVVAGLRLYQWVALATVVLGAVFTTVDAPTWTHAVSLTPEALAWGVGCGLVTGAALGVDFPDGKRRLSRLA